MNVSQPTPATTSGVGGPCPAGRYCPAQTSDPTNLCPVGTYRDVEYGAQLSDCFDCTLGNYCGMQGLANVSGPCSPGFYCLVGSDSPTPTGEQCWTGFVAMYWTNEAVVWGLSQIEAFSVIVWKGKYLWGQNRVLTCTQMEFLMFCGYSVVGCMWLCIRKPDMSKRKLAILDNAHLKVLTLLFHAKIGFAKWR